MTTIGIIGGGNLGGAIAKGLIESSFISRRQLAISRRNVQPLADFRKQGVLVTSSNAELAKFSKTIILAVKPFQAEAVLKEIKPYVGKERKLVVSVVTGYWIKDIASVIGSDNAIFRGMPNTAIEVLQGTTAVCKHNASEEESKFVHDMFGTLGLTVPVEEHLMDAATVLGSCGVAFALRYIRATIQSGVEVGFDSVTATTIAAQTVKGAAELLLKKGTHPEFEIDRVATPKGCTITGLNKMEHEGFSASLIQGVVASYKKIKNNFD